MIEDKTRLWATVTVVSVALVAITAMLIVGVPVTDIATAFGAIGTLAASIFVLREVQQVKTQTNGTLKTLQERYDALQADFLDYAKRQPPVGNDGDSGHSV